MEGTVEFWLKDEDVQKLEKKKDHYFVVTFGESKKDIACYIDTQKVKPTKDFRVSDKKRDEAYIKATYKTLTDQLLKFGKEETKE